MSDSPAEFSKRYLTYKVPVSDPPRTVTVDLKALRYRNAAREGFTPQSAEMLAKDAVAGKGTGWVPAIQAAFCGKGSPEGIAKVLELVAKHDLWAKGDPKWGEDLKKQSIPIEEKLRRYCDRMIGLDCLGFAINYVQSQMRLVQDLSPLNADLANFRVTPFVPRSTLLEFHTGDVVVWNEPPRHIAVVDSGRPPSLSQGLLAGFPIVMAAADSNFGPEGLVTASFNLNPKGAPGTYDFVGKSRSDLVRVFGPVVPFF
ncbi:MAG: hypothetical protein NEA02_08185 [Thermoanaerobaculia bacterium]|nr:hypothetical protein [Thermoanaerobaculia bacterium]